jgi:hypothetical protein
MFVSVEVTVSSGGHVVAGDEIRGVLRVSLQEYDENDCSSASASSASLRSKSAPSLFVKGAVVHVRACETAAWECDDGEQVLDRAPICDYTIRVSPEDCSFELTSRASLPYPPTALATLRMRSGLIHLR